MQSLTIRLSDDIDARLNKLARRTHRTKTFYVRQAILNYLEDLEDTYDAVNILREEQASYTLAEVVKDLNFTEQELKEIGLGN